MAIEVYKGFTIEPVYERDCWRVLLRRLDGALIRTAPDATMPHWLSGRHPSERDAVEQVKHAIDMGQFT